eukprot:UN13246
MINNQSITVPEAASRMQQKSYHHTDVKLVLRMIETKYSEQFDPIIGDISTYYIKTWRFSDIKSFVDTKSKIFELDDDAKARLLIFIVFIKVTTY